MRGYGTPIYVNIRYPFVVDPPRIASDNNPVGMYRREFEVPTDWQGKQIVLQFGGVSSAYYVWINGQRVGYKARTADCRPSSTLPTSHTPARTRWPCRCFAGATAATWKTRIIGG